MKTLLFSLCLFSSSVYAQNPPTAGNQLSPQELQQINAQIESVQKDIALKLNLADNYLKLGHLYSRMNNADKAQEAFENVLTLDAQNSKAHFMLGLIYEKKKLNDKALYHWQQCQLYSKNPEIKQIAQKHIDYLSRK